MTTGESERDRSPGVVVVSSLFPHEGQPFAGLFVRERMARVAEHMPVTVVVPVPWFPGQALLRRWRPHFRPPAPRESEWGGLRIVFPRFLSVPGVLKRLDGWLMSRAVRRAVARLRTRGEPVDVLDAHFGYPDGYAAVLAGRALGLPVTVTFRGTEARLCREPWARRRLRATVGGAARVFAVSDSLRRLAVEIGAPPGNAETMPNGVDVQRFRPHDRNEARARLGIPESAPVLITVGGLTERKGQHRVIECLPGLIRRYPELVYLIVGGASGEGDWEQQLREQVASLGLNDHVRFLGPIAPDELAWPLSAADVFALPTRNEGWANVLLEAMACGLPVVATDVGGNREVVAGPSLGSLVAFGDGDALAAALDEALARQWDRTAIRAHAEASQWDRTVMRLVAAFRALTAGAGRTESPARTLQEGG